MKKLKKPLGLLLSLIMVFGMFAGLPVSAANGDTFTAEIGKWVKGELNGNNLYRYSDLYAKVVFCRVNPEKTADFDALEDKWAFDVVWNKTLDQTPRGNTCWLYAIQSGLMVTSWGDVAERSGDGYIYAQADGTVTNDGAVIYAWTFETFTLTEHEAVASTTTRQGHIEYYTSGGEGDQRYFKKDGDSYIQITQEETLLPLAGHQISYVDADGADMGTQECTDLKYDTRELNNGWYAVTSNTSTYRNRLNVSGDVNLILCDGATLTCPKGITVGAGNSLTIWAQQNGTGSLVVSEAESFYAGIGSYNGPAGAVTVNGGKLRVTGGQMSPGIGAGGRGSDAAVTINGGEVTANGGENGVGVGSCYYASSDDGVNVTVTVNGGALTATGSNAAGIGGGSLAQHGAIRVTINGGTVTATGGGAPGIGCGGNGNVDTDVILSYDDASLSTIVSANGYDGSVTFEKTFTNGSRYFEHGTVAEDNATLANTTLTPHPHHDYVHYAATSPAYNTEENIYINGYLEHYICSGCGTWYVSSENEGEYREITWEELAIPYFTYAADDYGAALTGFNGSDADIVIPENVPSDYPDAQLRGKRVISINAEVFKNNTALTSVKGANGVERIGSQAFMGCTNLKTAEFGTALYRIDDHAFSGCAALTSFTCPSERPFEDYFPTAFLGCDQLTFYCSHYGFFPAIVEHDYPDRPYIGIDDHDYIDNWSWAEDYSAATLELRCSSCAFRQTLNGSVSSEITRAATYTIPGVRTYTATTECAGEVFVDYQYEDVFVQTVPVSYIDADGAEQTMQAIELTGDETALPEGWYAVTKDIGFDTKVALSGTVNLILCDGATLTSVAPNEEGFLEGTSATMNIYGQSEGSGKMLLSNNATPDEDVSMVYGFNVNVLNLYGGTIKDNDEINYNMLVAMNSLTVYGGTVEGCGLLAAGNITVNGGEITGDHIGTNAISSAMGSAFINGGNIHISGWKYGIHAAVDIVLDLQSSADSVYTNVYHCGGKVKLQSRHTNGKAIIEEGELSNLSLVNQKTIRRYDPSIFAGHSLSLSGDIGVNFYLDLTAEQAANATVSFTWFDKLIDNAALVYDEDYDLYKTTCYVSAAEMTYNIVANVTINGETFIDSYSVVEYASVILNDEDYINSYSGKEEVEEYAQLAVLIGALLDYGTKAQILFDRNTEYPANGGTDFLSDKVNASDIPVRMSDMNADLSAYGLEYTGSTIVCLAGTSMRHYYKITDRELFNEVKDTVTFDGNPVSYTVKGDEIYFEKKNIAAADLDTVYTLTIGSTDYRYSVLDYIRRCLESESVNQETKDLVTAAYRYNRRADAYFGS